MSHTLCDCSNSSRLPLVDHSDQFHQTQITPFYRGLCGTHRGTHRLYDSLSSPPVAGVWWAHTLDWLYDSLSSPPVAGVWWAHTLDWLYDSLSSPPVAGVWWAHTLDWLYGALSSPPVAGVWWAHWCRCPVIHQVDAAHWWWLRRDPPPPPHMIVKRFGCTRIHKALYKCIIHSLITSEFSKCFDFNFSICFKLHQNNVKTQKITFFILVDFNNYHTIHFESLYLWSLKADICTMVKVVETRQLAVVLNISLWSKHDKHFTFLNYLHFSSHFLLKINILIEKSN